MTDSVGGGREVYTVRANGHDWIVCRDSAQEPVASFTDKGAALAFAMRLVRRRAVTLTAAVAVACQKRTAQSRQGCPAERLS